MRLEFSPLAEVDLEAIGDYIAKDSPGNALRFRQEWIYGRSCFCSGSSSCRFHNHLRTRRIYAAYSSPNFSNSKRSSG